jgi:L-lysine exporter family protein LysE/ArgO
MELLFIYVLQGFLLGIAYVAPIGMQNLYVINSAIKMSKIRAYQVALITIVFDISLAMACFFGIGFFIEKLPFFKGIIILVGSFVLLYIGYKLIVEKPKLDKEIEVNKPITAIAIICFAVTWLNPQAILDGTLLLGGIRASLPSEASIFFIGGVALASLTWFLSLATITSMFKSLINEKAIRAINLVCGTIICLYGLNLMLSLYGLIFN